jgi:Ca2+-binding EF-hand superfamily protein
MTVAGASFRTLVLAGTALLLASCATTETPKHHRWNPNGTPRNEDWHSASGMLMRYDANHDGVLTKKELLTGLHKDFDAFDAGHTGCLTGDQVTAINEARASVDSAAASPLIDWKGKGCVDFDEFSATALSLFEQLDTNGDGQLTEKELHPRPGQAAPAAPPPPSDEGGGGGGGGPGGGPY